MRPQTEHIGIDWTDCRLVERNPLKLHGVPVLKRTRLQADAVVENYESGSPINEISENFSVSEEIIGELLAFAAQKRKLTVSCQ
jgi:uncharacterized protein (DUF433 family)